ncbi:MAG: ABC transporter permease [Bacteroidota bacterium]
MVRNIYLSLRVNLLELSRNRAALFWALTFPLFIYTVFYLIFGVFNDEDYATFLLTGVLAMTIAANGLFGVGSIVKRIYQGGTIRLMKKMPLNILSYFVGMVLNRFIMLIGLFLFLNVAAFFISGQMIGPAQIPSVILGLFVGLWIFSFVGLTLSFGNIKKNSEYSIVNIIYFLMLFTSNALYNISDFNPNVETIANVLPLNDILHLLRSEPCNLVSITLWMIIPVAVFYYLFRKVDYTR